MSLMGAVVAAAASRRLTAPERRAIITGAGTLDQPAEAFLTGIGAHLPSAGVAVNERTATGIPVVYACDKVIHQDVAKTTVRIKKRLPNGTCETDRDHPAYPTLHDMANPVMTAYEFKETLQAYLNLWGNAYADIERLLVSTNVQPRKRLEIRLWPLDASRMTVSINELNQLQYSYQMPGSTKPKIWIYDPALPPIFHLRQNSRDGIVGRSPIQVLREAMGTAIASDRFVGRLYGQGGHPRVALSTTQKLTDGAARRIRSDFEELTVGEHNWHRVVVLDHDLKPVPLVMPNRDAQFVELRKLGRDELCGAFRVPPHKVADLASSTNNNIEHQAIEHVGDCLLPHFICWQQATARDLLNPISKGTHFAQFDVDSLIVGDRKSLNDALHIQRQDGIISANEYRRAIGMDDQISTENGGDVYLVNGNMVPIGEAAAPTPDPPTAAAPAAPATPTPDPGVARVVELGERLLTATADRADRASRETADLVAAIRAQPAPAPPQFTMADGAVRIEMAPIHLPHIEVPQPHITVESPTIHVDVAAPIVQPTIHVDVPTPEVTLERVTVAVPPVPKRNRQVRVRRQADGSLLGEIEEG